MYYLSLQWTDSFPPRPKPRHHPWYTSRRRRASYWKHRCGSLALYAALSHCIIRPRTTALLRPHPKTGKATPTTLLRKPHFAGLPVRPSLYFGDSGETPRWQRSCLRTRVPVHGCSSCSSTTTLLVALGAHTKGLRIPWRENRDLLLGQTPTETERWRSGNSQKIQTG